MRHRSPVVLALLVVAALAGAAAPASGSTAGTAVTAALAGGPLALAVAQPSVAYSFGLDGQDQAQAQVVGLEPSDNTGTGNGWDVTVVSTALANGSGQVVPSSWSLVLNGSAISPSATTGLTPAANGPGTYTLPSGNTATYPLAVPGVHGGSNPTPAVVYSAAAGSGMGDFVLPADLWLSVPANALAGSYSATLTWAVAQGPGVASSGAVAYDNQVVADGAVDFWPLDDASGASSATNVVNSSQAGTVGSGVTLGQPGPVPPQTAAAFNGKGDIGTPANPSSSSGFSVVVWYNLEGKLPTNNPRLVANSHVDGNGGGGFELFVVGVGGNNWVVGSVCWSVGQTPHGTGGGTLCTGQVSTSGWHMLAATWTGSTLAVYQDGALVGTLAYSGSLAPGPEDVALGYDPDYSSDYYTGDMADVALFTSALSAAQVAHLYESA